MADEKADREPAKYVGQAVYDGKRPLTDTQLARAQETVRKSKEAELLQSSTPASFGAWLTENEGTLPVDFEFDADTVDETAKNSRFRTILTPEDAEAVLSMLENPPEPTEALVDAMRVQDKAKNSRSGF